MVLAAGSAGHAIAIAGGRHAMGGQQFGTRTRSARYDRADGVLDFDPERGEIEAEAGIMWPALIAWLHASTGGPEEPRGGSSRSRPAPTALPWAGRSRRMFMAVYWVADRSSTM